MKYAVVSDIHANAAALRLVLADARRAGAECVVCLGDIVGYGPEPAETVRLVREAGAVVVAGNHDDAVSGRMAAKDFIGLAADAVARHRAALSANDRSWLASLPYRVALDGGALAVHGDATDSERFYYIENEDDAAVNFRATDAALLFVGHTHVPGLFLTGRSGRVYQTPPQDFTLEDGKRYIVNVGSVGYPRESGGKCLSSYVLYDSTERTVTFRFLPFAVSSVMQRGTDSAGRRRLFLALAGIAGLALAGLAVAVFRPNPPPPPALDAADNPALVVRQEALPIPFRATHVRAHLQLQKGSPPVQLQVEFFAEKGRLLRTITKTVLKKNAERLTIPPGALSVTLTVLRQKAEDIPLVVQFAPAVN